MTSPCTFLRAGDLTAIVGDDTPRGAGGCQYSGIWSLYHKSSIFSPFQAGMAGFLAGAHRGTEPKLEVIGASSARLVKEPDERTPFATTIGTYRLREPHYIDYTFEAAFSEDAKDIPDCIEFLWASYMDSPQDPSIYFLENGLWTTITPRIHGLDATVFPTGLTGKYHQDWERRVAGERWKEQANFWESDSGHSFDHPFYFGLIHGMVFLTMADTHRDFRIFVSPVGGGPSAVPGQMSPAWDFAWKVWHAKPGETRTLKIRLAYFLQPRFDLPKQVWLEWERFREEYPTRSD